MHKKHFYCKSVRVFNYFEVLVIFFLTTDSDEYLFALNWPFIPGKQQKF